MSKLKLYLETSVWNYACGQGGPEAQEATLQLLGASKGGGYEIFVSTLVLQELLRTPDPSRREKLMKAVAEHQPVELDVDAAAERLADQYVAHQLVVERYRNDAVHVAIATLAQIDIVVSWNLKHIVNPRTRRTVNGLNNMLGYGRIDFGTPEEVLADAP